MLSSAALYLGGLRLCWKTNLTTGSRRWTTFFRARGVGHGWRRASFVVSLSLAHLRRRDGFLHPIFFTNFFIQGVQFRCVSRPFFDPFRDVLQLLFIFFLINSHKFLPIYFINFFFIIFFIMILRLINSAVFVVVIIIFIVFFFAILLIFR